MAEQYDAIVIGAGIGGLAAGLLLSHRGLKTIVLEQHQFVGGRLTSFDREGFHWDLGVHFISRSDKGPVGDVFRRVGIPNPIKYIQVRPQSSYKGKVRTFPKDLKELVAEKDYNAVLTFLKDIRNTPIEKTKEYDHVTLMSYVSKYTEDPLLLGWVQSVAAIYMGTSLLEASTGEFMRCMIWEIEAKASGYPDGGCDSIALAYAAGIKQFGGEIKTGAKVQQILIENGCAVGVIAEDVLYTSDLIVSNADLKNTVLNLVGEKYFTPDYVTNVSTLKYTQGIGVILRIALDKKLTDIHMLGHIATFDREAQGIEIRNGNIGDDINLMLVVPSNFSEKIAPPGKQYVCVVGLIHGGFPVEYKDAVVEATFKTTERIIPGLRDHLLWHNVMTHRELGNMLGEGGASIGVAQTVDQVGAKRPKIKSPIEGLYVVGGEAGGTGVGIELCINSAMEFIDLYCPK